MCDHGLRLLATLLACGLLKRCGIVYIWYGQVLSTILLLACSLTRLP